MFPRLITTGLPLLSTGLVQIATDASILTYVVPALQKGDAATVFAASFRKTLQGEGHPGLAEKLFAAYGIPDGVSGAGAGEAGEKEALRAIVALATDLLFRAGARSYVDKWPPVTAGQEEKDQAWFYELALPNPWPGPWQGTAAHIMDVALFFGNFEEALPAAGGDGELAGYRKAAREWAEHVLRFVAGKGSGWEAGSEVGVFEVDGVRKVAREEEVAEDRLMGVLRAEDVGVGVVVGAWERFMRGE